MTTPTNAKPSNAGLSRLLDPATVAPLLEGVLRTTAALQGPVRKLRVERCWPGRRGEFIFEWSFALGPRPRYTLFGVGPIEAPAGVPEVHAASIGPEGLRGVRVYRPDWKLLVHSPDCDPAMPHLAECLDPGRMAPALKPLWGADPEAKSCAEAPAECRLLGYRSGRRAAIAYHRPGVNSTSGRLLGKTFQDGRGENLVRIHRQLGAQLAQHSHGRVRVPAPVGYLSDLRMAVFAWAPGRPATGKASPPPPAASAAVNALSVLHRTAVRGVSAFTVRDECGIVKHWHAALETLDPPSAAATKSLLDRLMETAETVGATARCLIHRDFYDRQFVVDGRTTTLLDLDTLALGDPCVDLGNLLAHLFLSSMAAGGKPADFEQLVKQVTDRYQQQMAPVDRRALAFFCATALFRVGAVHAVRTATRRHAAALWALAAEVLPADTAQETRLTQQPIATRGSP